MADYSIRKYGDFAARVVLNIVAPDGSTAPADTSEYTILCKIRDRIDHPYRPSQYPAPNQYIPGNVASFTVANVAGESSKVDITMADTVTETFTSTQYAADDELPLLNFELTTIATGEKLQTSPQTVEILETQAHD